MSTKRAMVSPLGEPAQIVEGFVVVDGALDAPFARRVMAKARKLDPVPMKANSRVAAARALAGSAGQSPAPRRRRR